MHRNPNGERGPNGRRLCGWCRKEVSPPRRTWCSEDCVRAYLARSSSAGIRAAAKKRDGGVCAICRIDCGWIERTARSLGGFGYRGERCHQDFFLETLRERGFDVPRRWRGWSGFHLWEADHIVPVIRGGTHDPENIRTLCRPCHKRETAKLAATRAAARRDSQAGLPFGPLEAS